MNIVAHVQARIGSERLPNKVMMEVVGKPILWHIVNRINHAKKVTNIVICTSDNEKDKEIINFAKENNIDYFAGEEIDLTDRHYQAAKEFNSEVIVRITGDCPFIDPEIIDKLIEYYLSNEDKYDYVSNINPPTYPDGLDVEVFPFAVLERIWKEVKDIIKREWITANIFEHPETFRLSNIENKSDLSKQRWTIDYEEDFEFIKKIYEELYSKKQIFLMKDILDLLKQKPSLLEINEKYSRNESYIEDIKKTLSK